MGYVNKGLYSAETAYAKNDIVTGSDDVVYVCIQPTTAGIPFTNTNYFSKVQGGMEDVIPMLNAMTAALADLEERVTALEPEDEEDPTEDPAADPTDTET